MEKASFRLLRVIFITSLVGWMQSIFAAPVQLNLSELWPDGNFMVQNVKRFASAVSRETKGDVVIKVFSSGALGFNGPEQIRAVRRGQVAMADIIASQQVAEDPLFGIEGVPFLVSSHGELRMLHKFARPALEKLAASKFNQKILYMVPSPSQYLFLKIKTDKLADFNKIRIRGADQSTVDICTAMGMTGVLIPLDGLIPALVTGMVSGVSTSATTAVDAELWNSLKYVYPTNHTWSSNMVTINLDAWKKIPAAHQKTIEAIAARMEPEFWEISAKADGESLKQLIESGMEVVQIPPAMMGDIRKRTKPLMDAYLKRAPAAEPIVKKYLSAVGR